MITEKEWEELALKVGRKVAEKNKAYGDSVRNAARIMQILYPKGIAFDQIPGALLTVRMLDKLSRMANDPEFGNEDPPFDMAGYSLLWMELQENGLDKAALDDNIPAELKAANPGSRKEWQNVLGSLSLFRLKQAAGVILDGVENPNWIRGASKDALVSKILDHRFPPKER